VGLPDAEDALSQEVIRLTQHFDETLELLRSLYHGGNLDTDETEMVEELFERQSHPL